MAKKGPKKTDRQGQGGASSGKPARSGGSSKKLSKKPADRPAPKGKAAPTAKHAPTPQELAGQEALKELRRKIDRIDMRLVRLLNDRASLVVEVGKSKRNTGAPIYAPHREAEVLAKALKANTGPLPDRAVEGVFRELMSGSFAIEQPLRIGYLGPPGSFSHAAAMAHFGSSVSFEDLREIRGVFTEVRRGHVDYGLVPIENSTHGGVAEALDAFLETAGEVTIYAEVQLAVHLALLANCQPSQIRRVHAKPEASAQCRTWLATQYPQAEVLAAASSSRAAMTAAEECKLAESIGAEPGSAAVGPALAGELYGLRVLFADIEDNPNNVTRFFVISRHRAMRSGDDKTSIMFKTADKPGALVEVLKVFSDAGINLAHIDKRPSGRTNWEYTFFLDIEGHREDAQLASALDEVERHCKELSVLGSYPRSRRIL